MAMHLFLDLPESLRSPRLEALRTLALSTRGEVHDLTGHPEGQRPVLLLKLLEERSLSPDECTLLGSTPASQACAAAGRVRFARLRTGMPWESPVPLDADFPDLEAAVGWFDRHAKLETCGWPIATVGGLLFRPDGKAFFVRTAKWSGKWGTPGGKIDYGETHLTAFVRELHEETGLACVAPKLVLVQEAIEDPDFHKPRHFLLLNLVGRTEAATTQLNHESLDGRWFSLEESLELDLNRPTRQLVDHLLAHPGDLP